MSTLAMLVVAAAATAVQVVIRLGLGRRRPVGDEMEYLARATSSDPFGPTPFLRVPLMATFVRLTGPDEGRIRNACSVVAIATVVLVAAAGLTVHGPAGAIVSGTLFMLLPDRILLSQHIWPDVLLGLVHAGLVAVILGWGGRGTLFPCLLGLAAAIAVLVRIDALVLLPALTVLGVNGPVDDGAIGVAALWVPALALLGLLTLYNRRAYGIALPDNTALFNVSVLAAEHRSAAEPSVPVDALVRSIWPEWEESTDRGRVDGFRRALAQIAREPARLARGLVGRVRQMLGPDSFARDRLLAPETGAYPELAPLLRAAFTSALRVSFPCLATLALAGVTTGSSGRIDYLLPAVATLVVACLFQKRERRDSNPRPPA
jgi:hypothetical protein